jgi:hypothetical protein
VLAQSGQELKGQLEFKDASSSPRGPALKTFQLDGVIRDNVITLRYWGMNDELGTGCMTGVFLSEELIEGACVYYEHASRNIVTDRYSWRLESRST